jgi:HAMP domain-containing protein
MGLRLKFNLALGIATLVAILLASFLARKFLEHNAREEILDSAGLMMQSAIAVRGYTVDEIRPLLALQQKRQFLPQTVPAYAAHRYVKHLQKTYPDYSYREAALNPTNPADRATEWEADIVNWFRDHDTTKELIGTRETPTGPSLYMSRPIRITDKACLSCHSTPSAAPRTLIASYGSDNGFGWKLHEVVGAQIVSVPMRVPLERANATFLVFVGVVCGIFLLIGILANIMLHFLVIRPIREMSDKANQISLGALNVPELKVTGKDEIAVLGQSFNRMHRSLSNAVRILDETEL